jgi:hypothetical protein
MTFRSFQQSKIFQVQSTSIILSRPAQRFGCPLLTIFEINTPLFVKTEIKFSATILVGSSGSPSIVVITFLLIFPRFESSQINTRTIYTLGAGAVVNHHDIRQLSLQY